MMIDPQMRWKGPFPYSVLEGVGISPQATLQQVKDASFELMTQGKMTPEVRAAWDELRVKRRRLLVDFFLHRVDFDEQTESFLEGVKNEIESITRPGATNPADDIQFDS